jgi:hypothetical protein
MTSVLAAILAAALQQPAKTEETGSLSASNLTPGALALLLRVPEDSKDPALFARLWSENEEAQLQAIAALSEQDAGRVAVRLADQSKSGSLRVQGEAFVKAGKAPAGPDPVVARAIADIDGVARFPKVPAGRYHLFATRPQSADLHRSEVDVAAGKETALDAKSVPAAPDGVRLVRISSGGQIVAELPLRLGEAVEVPVSGPTVRVEVTDAPAAGGERLGRIQLASRVYGIFVKLDPGFAAKPGEEVVIVRDGREVARTKIVRVMSGDPRYPDGAAQTVTDPGAVRKGDEVRRVKEENK